MLFCVVMKKINFVAFWAFPLKSVAKFLWLVAVILTVNGTRREKLTVHNTTKSQKTLIVSSLGADHLRELLAASPLLDSKHALLCMSHSVPSSNLLR